MPHPRLAQMPLHEIRARAILEVDIGPSGASDLLAFCGGEPDVPTPAFIVQAAHAALDAGDAIDSALRAITKGETVRYCQKIFGPTFNV